MKSPTSHPRSVAHPWSGIVRLSQALREQPGPHLSRGFLILVVVLGAITLTVSKSTKLLMSWTNPNYVASKRFHRVLALGLSDKAAIRADFEDTLAGQLAALGVEAVPANTILLRPESSQLDLDYLRTQIRENKIDAVVVSRLIKVETSITYIPGDAYVVPFPYYNTFYGYYGTVYPVVYSPDYLREEKRVRIETNLYVIQSANGELAWTGITDTFNPFSAQKAVNGLVKVVVKQMQNDGVL